MNGFIIGLAGVIRLSSSFFGASALFLALHYGAGLGKLLSFAIAFLWYWAGSFLTGYLVSISSGKDDHRK